MIINIPQNDTKLVELSFSSKFPAKLRNGALVDCCIVQSATNPALDECNDTGSENKIQMIEIM